MAIEFGSRKETFENFKVYETMLPAVPLRSRWARCAACPTPAP